MPVSTSRLTFAALALTLGVFSGSIAPASAAGAGQGAVTVLEAVTVDRDADGFTPVQYRRGYYDDDGYYGPRRRGGYHDRRAYPRYQNRNATKQYLRQQREAQKRAIKRGYYANPNAFQQRGGGNSYSY